MRTNKEIENRIEELTPAYELAEDSYFSTLQEKSEGEIVNEVDFLKIESEYEILKKEIESLEWVLNE
jgi:hypothetical protein